MATAAPARERLRSEIDLRVETQGKSAGSGSRQILCALLLLVADLLTIGTSVFVAVFLRVRAVPHLDQNPAPVVFPLGEYRFFCSVWIVLIVFMGVEGLYTRRRTVWNEIGHVLKAIGLTVVTVFASLALTKLSAFASRSIILLTATILASLLPAVRYWLKWFLGKVGLWRKRILVLGTGAAARHAVQGLLSDPVLGYEVAGLLDDGVRRKGECIGICKGTAIYVIGDLSHARQQMERSRSRDVLIAMPDLEESELLGLINDLQPVCDSVYVVPHLGGLPMMNLHVDGFLRERVMMLKLSNNLSKPWNRWLKRSIDIALGTAIGLLVLPASLIIAILIKMDSEGPVLFVQNRLGFGTRIFRCLKFRTMHVHGDEVLSEYLRQNPQAAEEWSTYAKLRDYDPRVTRLGGFLRRWSLDELPQFLNVLRGEMSIVGPRPYLPEEHSRMGRGLATILAARPGITGFWQVNGRNHLTLDERVQLEAWYVRNWTVWLDCIVFAKTFKAVFRHHKMALVPWELEERM